MLTEQQIQELQNMEGVGSVSFDHAELYKLSQDSSFRAQKLDRKGESWGEAEVLVTPRTEAEIQKMVRWCNQNQVPIIVRGPGSGVSGSGIPVKGGVLLDLREHNKILDFNPENGHVKVQGSIILSELDEYLRDRGFTVGHYPQSFSIAGVAGSICERGSGTFSSLYGNVEDIVAELRVVLPDGAIYQSHYSPRSATGPDLRQLFIGSEGTLGIITEVTLKTYKVPEQRTFHSYAFPSIDEAIDVIRETLWLGIYPAVARIYDPVEGTAKHAQFTSESKGEWLMVLLFEGADEVVAAQETKVEELACKHGGRNLGPEPAVNWEKMRFDVSWFTDEIGDEGGIAESVEVSATWDKLPAVWESMREAALIEMDRVMGHISHVYRDGASLYVIASGKKADQDEVLAAYSRHWKNLTEASIRAGGTICHHHSAGLERAPWIEEGIGENGLDILRNIKRTMDPNDIMNPGKLALE